MLATFLLIHSIFIDFILCCFFSTQFFDYSVGNEKPQRRGSVGSLDSGMSISYTSASTGSRDNAKVRLMQQPFQVIAIYFGFFLLTDSTASTNLNPIFILHSKQPQGQSQSQSQPNQGILNAMNSGISPLLLATGGIGNTVAAASGPVAANLGQPGFLGAIFNRRERKLSKSDESGSSVSSAVAIAAIAATTTDRSTEV